MKSHNIASIKAQYLEKEAQSLLPKDKENIETGKRILKVQQWMLGDTEINLLETDTVSSNFLLAQKWPFELLNQERRIFYAFMAGNDTLAPKGKALSDKKCPKTLLNLSLLFRTEEKQQPYLSMLAANALLQSLKVELHKGGCELPLQIRWKHDILLDTTKVGEISLRHASVQKKFYTQLNVEVNVKSIPKNFGAYDFQPTYLEKHVKKQISMTELAQNVIINLARQLSFQQSVSQRKEEIRQKYEKQLIYLGQKVTIYDKKFEHIHHTGKFLGVTKQGHAILEGFQKPFQDGIMKFNIEARDYLSLYRGEY